MLKEDQIEQNFLDIEKRTTEKSDLSPYSVFYLYLTGIQHASAKHDFN